MGLEIIKKSMIVSWEPYNGNEYVKRGTYNFEINERLHISWYNFNK